MSQTEISRLRAGCFQTSITPPLGVSLAGYFHLRQAKRIRDDLFARALILEGTEGHLVLIGLDLAHVDGGICGEAASRISARTGIPAANVMISATHTHTGPEIVEGEPTKPCREYVEALPGMIADAAVGAWERMAPATLHCGCTHVHGYSHNRLSRLRDGGEVFGHFDDPRIIAPAGPVDPELLTLGVVDENGLLRALVVSFALHADVIGGGSADFVSADWPGELARVVACAHESDVVTLFLQGASGDINHVDRGHTFLPRSGEPKARQLGRALAGAAMYASERAEPMEAPHLGVRTARLDIPYYTRTPEILKEVEEIRKQPNPSYFDAAFAKAVEEWTHDGEVRKVGVQAMRIGDLGLVALPAELFCGIGLEIKRFSPFRRTMVVALANDRASVYVPTLEQATRGAYGARPILSRRLCAEAGQMLCDAGIGLLHELAAQDSKDGAGA